ncbi:hypothetical protein C5167_038830 [Papaver somniferum]|uniref:VQ domain-containing protein n=1 Tax=Papaver somniferum TaxID=3469 RepID=A0A4Y7IDS9_PAPSO|nr:protein MKS1-like [Papaver somniferum]RZC45890.1 hypothetical protein C5167_038830 [Papaver somniferum]
MDSSSSWDMSSGGSSGGKPSPKRELQGPRPTPLKIRKDSHKIKKLPVAPQLPNQQQQSYQQPGNNQLRPPVIIYTVSPKVIHTDPNDFMKLVQRLTGPSSSSYLPSPSTSLLQAQSSSSVDFDVGAISPAARYASIERTSPQGAAKFRVAEEDSSIIEGLEMGSTVERTMGTNPSILSPIPSSLPPISPGFFSPAIDPNSLSFVHDFSPFYNSGNRNLFDGSSNFLTSPSTNFLSPSITSPNPHNFDLFNQFLDP